jgi:hypothetical protein
VTATDLAAAFEEVSGATAAVRARGSGAARNRADALLEVCNRYVDDLFGSPVFGKGRMTSQKLSAHLGALNKASDDFLTIVRQERD